MTLGERAGGIAFAALVGALAGATIGSRRKVRAAIVGAAALACTEAVAPAGRAGAGRRAAVRGAAGGA